MEDRVKEVDSRNCEETIHKGAEELGVGVQKEEIFLNFLEKMRVFLIWVYFKNMYVRKYGK